MQHQLNSVEEHFRKEIIRRSAPWVGSVFLFIIFVRTITGYIKTGPGIVAFIISIIFYLLPWMLKKGVSYRLCSIFMMSAMSAIALIAGIFNGGVQAPANIVYATLPLVGFLTAGKFGARIAILYSATCLGIFIFGEHIGFIHVFQRPIAFSNYLTLAIFMGSIVSYLMANVYENTRRNQERRIIELVGVMQENSRLASLGEMASGVAHEINNPLSIIVGTADRVKRMLNDPTKTKDQIVAEIDTLRQVAFRAGNIAKGLQAFSRDAQSDPFTKVTTQQLVRETLNLCQERYKNHGVELRLNVAEDVELQCRETQISQVLLNLLNNAFDAVQELPEKWISLEIPRPQQNRVLMIVTDSGLGIPPEIAEKLMQPFFTTKQVGKGTGLGLSISHSIVEDHRGTLVLDTSSPNTRFVVNLPISQT